MFQDTVKLGERPCGVATVGTLWVKGRGASGTCVSNLWPLLLIPCGKEAIYRGGAVGGKPNMKNRLKCCLSWQTQPFFLGSLRPFPWFAQGGAGSSSWPDSLAQLLLLKGTHCCQAPPGVVPGRLWWGRCVSLSMLGPSLWTGMRQEGPWPSEAFASPCPVRQSAGLREARGGRRQGLPPGHPALTSLVFLSLLSVPAHPDRSTLN